MREQVEAFMRQFQDDLCLALETCDGKAKFQEDAWQHHSGGGGRTRVIQNGNVFEKGGVNFSAVTGSLPEKAAQSLLLPDPEYFATGVSVVIHPESPMVPITHMNVRYFEAGNGDAWFGGGIDLTPIYVDKEQGRFFHTQLKNTCDKHHPAYYPDFKKWADDYFYLTHRQETRGIGGVFCDRLMAKENITLQERFNFIQDLAYTFAPTYTALVNENRELTYNEQHKQWQLLRRGRYVEFNLAIDRGTKFGLETSGRIESILMSLPNLAGWEYNFKPEPGSAEAATQALLKKDIDWLNLN